MISTESIHSRFDAATDSNAWEWDEEARLVSRFRERIRFFAIRQVGPADAEDVAQETMRRVLVAIRNRRVRNLREPEAFVFQTARNICLQLHRSRSRESRAFDRYAAEPSEALRKGDPLGDLLEKETRDSLAESLQALSARDQALLRRFYRDGMDTAQVAGEMELTPEAVRVRKHRALRRLRSIVQDAWSGAGVPVPVG
jgi:RNA polymerase sigma-70 factor, ECF subfamily